MSQKQGSNKESPWLTGAERIFSTAARNIAAMLADLPR
jgi:hypothetical protein